MISVLFYILAVFLTQRTAYHSATIHVDRPWFEVLEYQYRHWTSVRKAKVQALQKSIRGFKPQWYQVIKTTPGGGMSISTPWYFRPVAKVVQWSRTD